MDTVTLDMSINVVDQHDNPIGVVARRDVFNLAVNFRVVHVLVFNSRGELLLQQLASVRERNLMHWGSSVAGYVFASENYFHAAARRVQQELGIQGCELREVGKTKMKDDGCLKFITVFSTVLNGPFNFDRSIIGDVRFESVDKIREQMSTGEIAFTPTFRHVLRFYDQQNRTTQ